jgi:hypothetical protein
MGQVMHIGQMRNKRGDTTYWLEDLRRRNCLRKLGLNRTIILKWTSEKYGVKMWTGFNWPTMG